MTKRPERYLVILESPGKQKKIKDILGEKYIVRASFGHIRDLDSKKLSIDIDNNFAPDYSVMRDKKNVVNDLSEASKRCSRVYLASDLDREGESIAWHIRETLKLPSEKTKRITFSEITKKAILTAIENPGDIDMNLNDAQQARRIIDRLLGYKISPILWKHLQSSYKKGESLSAGRVQSVVSKIIIDRENEIAKHESSATFKCNGEFKHNDRTIKCVLNEELPDKIGTDSFLEKNKECTYTLFPTVLKESTRKPSAPFITSTLQQEVSSKYRMSPKATMAVAQKLYECGLITYMRTDSKVLSGDCMDDIEKWVTEEYGESYSNKTSYSNDSKNAQEAHEAIRPCKININSIDEEECYTDQEKRIYKLIWKRTIASQMSHCKVMTATNKVKISGCDEYYFISKGEKVLFPGYTKVYKEYTEGEDSDDDTESSDYFENEKKIVVKREKVTATMKYSKPKHARYTEASLVKQLEKLGIGRPSTYSNMVSVIQNRGYTEKKSLDGEKRQIDIFTLGENNNIVNSKREVKMGGEKNKLFPTTIGRIVNDYLNKEFPILLDYDFTNQLENSLDRISRGEVVWHKIVKRVYNIFRERIDLLAGNVKLAKTDYNRVLGRTSDGEYSTYIAKYGPVICLTLENGNKKFASIKEGEMDKICIGDAKKLFEYPKTLGEYRKVQVNLCKGQYGFYLKYNGKNIGCRGEEPPSDLESAIEIINASAQVSSNSSDQNSGVLKIISEDIVIKNGKYGKYIQYKNKTNVSIYKKINIDELDNDSCMELINKKLKKT